MSLTAKVTENDKIICSLNYASSAHIRGLFPNKKDLVCPECLTMVFPRSRVNFVNHFVHSNKNDHCSLCNESIEHQMAKVFIYETLKQMIDKGEVFVEYPIYDDSGRLIRRADVMLLFSRESGIAFEVQYSNISLEQIKQRTEDYFSNGYDVQWILGETFNNHEVETWLSKEGTLVRLSSYQEICSVNSSEYLSHFKHI